MTNYNTILAALEFPCVHKSKSWPVWEIRARGWAEIKQSEACKKLVLRAVLSQFSKSLLAYSENPLEEGLRGNWQTTKDGFFVIPADINFDQFYSWLYLGNWIIWHSVETLGRETAKGLASFNPEMMANIGQEVGADYVICSFHDNDPWFVYLRPSLITSES